MNFFTLDQETLFIELELSDLTLEQKLAVWEKISQVLGLRVLETILSELSLSKQQFFVQKLLGSEDEEKARGFLSENILDLDPKIEAAITKAKEELKREIRQAKIKSNKK